MFAPLDYAIGTLTLGHFLFAFVLAAINAISSADDRRPTTYFLWYFPLLVVVYLLLAPVVGQIAGERYNFRQVWPTALFFGFLGSTVFYLVVASKEQKALKDWPFLLLAWILHGGFFSVGALAFLFVVPWLVDTLPFLDTPPQPWGVVN